MALHNAIDDHDERTGWPADLHIRATQSRNQEPADDRRPQASLRRQARGNGKSHGQRQRDNAYGDTCTHVAQRHLARVAAQAVEQAGVKAVQFQGV